MVPVLLPLRRPVPERQGDPGLPVGVRDRRGVRGRRGLRRVQEALQEGLG